MNNISNNRIRSDVRYYTALIDVLKPNNTQSLTVKV